MSISAKDISGGSAGQMDALLLLANPEKLKQRIEAFNSAESAAKEQIELAGPASEIVSIRGEIDNLKDEAEKVLYDATEASDKIIADAGVIADGIISEAESDSDNLEKAAVENVKKAEARISGIKAHESAVQRQVEVAGRRSSELDQLESTLQQKADDLDVREQELDGEKEKLAEVRELINLALR